MSVPHTGSLSARIAGELYRFDGYIWSGPAANTIATLNAATAAAPTQHLDVRELAEGILRSTGISGSVVDWTPDRWLEDLPPEAVD